MSFGGDQLRNGVREGRIRVDIEYWYRVASLLHAALGEDDSDEVHAGLLEEGHRGRRGQEADVGGRDVAYHIAAVVDDSYRCDAFVAHEDEGFCEWCVGAMNVSVRVRPVSSRGGQNALDRDDLLRSNAQVPQQNGVQPVNDLEVDAFIPEELEHR